jgi:uncharacterized protein YoxC
MNITICVLIVIVMLQNWLNGVKLKKQERRQINMANTLQDVRDAVAELQTGVGDFTSSVEELLNKIEAGEDTSDIVASLRTSIDSLKATDEKVDAAVADNAEIPTEPTA